MDAMPTKYKTLCESQTMKITDDTPIFFHNYILVPLFWINTFVNKQIDQIQKKKDSLNDF